MLCLIMTKSHYIRFGTYRIGEHRRTRVRGLSCKPNIYSSKIFLLTVPMRCFFCGSFMLFLSCYPPMKSEGYSFGVVRASVRPSIPSVRPSVRPSGFISQYLFIRFDSFLVQMISTIDSRYPISLVKIDPLTLELLPLF